MRKSLDIIVGGQYGSEGKGKVAYLLAKSSRHKCVIRVGGPNSGHTANGHVLRQLPVSALIPGGVCIISAGSYINTVLLQREIAIHKPKHLLIDSKAVVLTESESTSMRDRIGSTLSGTGCGVVDRVERKETLFVSEIPEFQEYLASTAYIHDVIRINGGILEGTQGFGLSNIHTDCYPYATSRDTTAAGFLSELGMSPFDVRHIYLVIRSFTIRVAGNSGPLKRETSWGAIGVNNEHTSATNKLRRVGKFDQELVRKAIAYNQPTKVVLNHMDYVKDHNMFLKYVQREIGRSVDYIGTSPYTMDKRS